MLGEKGGKIDYSKTDDEYFENVFQGGELNDNNVPKMRTGSDE